MTGTELMGFPLELFRMVSIRFPSARITQVVELELVVTVLVVCVVKIVTVLFLGKVPAAKPATKAIAITAAMMAPRASFLIPDSWQVIFWRVGLIILVPRTT